ncbi:NERD domain-containing protein, partial [Microvirga sp. 3-52]|nr:NERD domain-containing protein [Microvirga sp. 3-52]
ANAGINGEKVLEAIFNKYKLTFDHAIYHGMNLRSTGKFQVDNLFLSRQGVFILEVKNIKGRIRFSEETNQMIRTLDTGQVDAFECPSVQLERNRYLLEDWFHSRNFSIPIHTAVVFPNPRQLVENTRPHLNILFPNEVPTKLRKRDSNPPVID